MGPLTKGLNSGSLTLSTSSIATDKLGNGVAVAFDGYASISTDNGFTWGPLLEGLNCGYSNADFSALAAISPPL